MAQILKSTDNRFAVVGIESYCECGTLLFSAVHRIFFVTLKSLADQVLFVKCQDREWNRETAVGIVFVPHIAVRALALTRHREALETASGIEDSARPRPISQRLYGSPDPIGRQRFETLRQPWPLCVRDVLRSLQTLLAVLPGLCMRFHAPLVESLASGFVVAEDPGRHAFEQHPIEGCRQAGMRPPEQFKRGAQVDD